MQEQIHSRSRGTAKGSRLRQSAYLDDKSFRMDLKELLMLVFALGW